MVLFLKIKCLLVLFMKILCVINPDAFITRFSMMYGSSDVPVPIFAYVASCSSPSIESGAETEFIINCLLSQLSSKLVPSCLNSEKEVTSTMLIIRSGKRFMNFLIHRSPFISAR